MCLDKNKTIHRRVCKQLCVHQQSICFRWKKKLDRNLRYMPLSRDFHCFLNQSHQTFIWLDSSFSTIVIISGWSFWVLLKGMVIIKEAGKEGTLAERRTEFMTICSRLGIRGQQTRGSTLLQVASWKQSD